VGIEIARPLWLLALPVVAVLLVAARYPWLVAARRTEGHAMGGGMRRTDGHAGGQEMRRTSRRALRHELRRIALRLAWTGLLLLALAEPTLIRFLPRQAVVLVTDVSASVGPAREQVEQAARAAVARVRDGDLVGIVAVGAGAQVQEYPVAAPLSDRISVAVRDDGSDLAAGLRLAAAVIPEGYRGRAVLVSDGRQTAGDAVAAARELAARGLTVDVLPVGTESRDVVLADVSLSATAREGEVASLLARVDAARAIRATMFVYRDDALVLERAVELRSGGQQIALPLPVGEPGLHRYRVDVVPEDPAADSTTVNNSLGAVQRVLGRPRVLLVAARPESVGLLPAALAAAGIDVATVAPEGVPADLAGWARYDATVLVDVPATALAPRTMELLEVAVRDLGRGLAMTGGPDAFGPGGYAETPIERAMPITMDVRGRGRTPRVALALVIDKSGSMSGEKLDMAKEAAARSIRFLQPEDQAAVVAFDSFPQLVAPLTSLAERQALENAVARITVGGGTDIFPAVASGFDLLRDVEADVKHVILLTDGQSGASGEYARLLDEMRAARVTLSTVAVGSDADTSLLEAMARIGRGRYHFAATPSAIPQIFSSETLLATRTILVDQRFFPATASASPILRGIGAVPALDGYVAVTPKDRGEVVLVSPEGDPVLAVWQYGSGRTVAWTPDLGNRWSAGWRASPAATALWGNLFSWLLPTPETSELVVRAESRTETIEGQAISVIAENRTALSDVRPTTATVIGPRGQVQEIALQPAGPGQYQGQLPTSEAGAYLILASQTLPGGEVRGDAGWVAPYPAEYRQVGIDQAYLARVAAAGGGTILADAAEAMRPPDAAAATRWPAAELLLVLAALCWPLEIAARRLTVPGSAWAGAARRVRTPLRLPTDGRVPARPSADIGQEPATVATAERLLRRKQAYRDRQS
jgi:Ca-activated chloride channel homolog